MPRTKVTSAQPLTILLLEQEMAGGLKSMGSRPAASDPEADVGGDMQPPSAAAAYPAAAAQDPQNTHR